MPYYGSVNVHWTIDGLEQETLKKFVMDFFESMFGKGNAPDDVLRKLSLNFDFYASIPDDLMVAAQDHVLEILDAEGGQYEVELGGDQIVEIESTTGEVRDIPALTIRPAEGQEGHGHVYEATFSRLTFEQINNNNNNNNHNGGGRRKKHRGTYRKRKSHRAAHRKSRRAGRR